MSSPARAQRRRAGRTLAALPDDPSMHLAAVLGLALDQAALQPGCVRCVRKAKTAEAAGGELTPISQSITWLPDVGPVCYGCFG